MHFCTKIFAVLPVQVPLQSSLAALNCLHCCVAASTPAFPGTSFQIGVITLWWAMSLMRPLCFKKEVENTHLYFMEGKYYFSESFLLGVGVCV